MKKLFLALIAAGSLATAQAQSAGSILVYGNLGLNMDKDEYKMQTTMFNITPGVGYQINDNITLGLRGNYGFTSSKDSSAGAKKLVASEFGIGVFGRYTKNIGSIFFIYGQLDLGYFGGTTKYDGKELPGTKFTGYEANIFPAVGINVCHGFALNFSFGGLGYNTQKYDYSGANASSNINLTFGQQVNFGISKNFGGHKIKGHHEPMDETRKIDTSDDSEDTAPKKKKAKSDDDE